MKTQSVFKICLPLLFSLCSGNLKSQSNSEKYQVAVGLRGGFTHGLTVKYNLKSNSALEGIIGVWPYHNSVTVLYEHIQPTSAPGINLYYGGGGHVSQYNGRVYYPKYWDRRVYYNYNSGVGLDLILGVECKLPKIPMAFSFDIKPFIEFQENGLSYMFIDPGLGIKITF